MKPCLVVTRRLPEAVEARIRRDFKAQLPQIDQPMPFEEILKRAEVACALLVTPTERIDAQLLGALPASVKIVATFSVGYDHIDLAAAKAKGIVITHTPDVLTDATAEIALLLLLGAARRAHEGETMMRDASWTGWTPTQLLGRQLSGKTLGILGMGRIGQAVAARARPFGLSGSDDLLGIRARIGRQGFEAGGQGDEVAQIAGIDKGQQGACQLLVGKAHQTKPLICQIGQQGAKARQMGFNVVIAPALENDRRHKARSDQALHARHHFGFQPLDIDLDEAALAFQSGSLG